MVLVLQNYGYLNLYQSKTRSNAYQPVRFDWPSAPYQRKSHLTGLLRQMIRRLGKLSVKAELDWLKKRLN
jgi:hypothetical protein